MQILMVSHTLGTWGGGDEVISQVNKHLRSLGVSTKVIIDKNPYRLWLETRKNMGWADIINFFQFPATLGMFPYCNKPVVWHCLDVPERYSRRWKRPFEAYHRYSVRKAFVIAANSEDVGYLRRHYGKAPDAIIEYGIDWDFFSNGQRPRSDGTFRILHVGPVGKFRNQLDSLEVFKEFVKLVPDSKLTFVGPRVMAGSGPQYWDKICRIVEENRLKYKVRMTGQLSREEVRDEYHSADVLLHPVSSTVGWITAFEATSAGLPVITPPEFVGAPSMLGSSLITRDYVDALLDVHHNRLRHRRLAGKASLWVRDNLSWKTYGDKMYSIFKEILEA